MGTGQPLPIGLAIFGSQIPDIDTTTSTIVERRQRRIGAEGGSLGKGFQILSLLML